MKVAASLCLLLALAATAARAESPSPLKRDLFTPHGDVRVWSPQTRVETPVPVVTREVRLTEFTLKTERDRVLRARLTIGTPYALPASLVGDVRAQALVTVHMYFRALPSP